MSPNIHVAKEVLVSHANAPLTPEGRWRLVRCVVIDGWPIARAAERFQVAQTTVRRWVARYEQHGRDGLVDRSSRPHRSPGRTPQPLVRKIVHLRLKRRWGPVRIAAELGLAPSTVHAVLVRCRLNRLADLDRATGEPIRRYEHATAGAMVHVDIKKVGNIPAGGGHRFHGQKVGRRNKQADKTGVTNRHGQPLRGYAFVHAAVDDYSRLAYAEIHDDERAETAAAFWQRAREWFAGYAITVERVLTDNGSCYRSRLWRDTLEATGAQPKFTRPYRPQTNGKVERFNRTLLNEWAYAKLYLSDSARRAALPAWLHTYNHHRPHTAIGNLAPASRAPNLPGHNT